MAKKQRKMEFLPKISRGYAVFDDAFGRMKTCQHGACTKQKKDAHNE